MKFLILKKKSSPPGGLEPPTFRLTVERASQLRHGGSVEGDALGIFCNFTMQTAGHMCSSSAVTS